MLQRGVIQQVRNQFRFAKVLNRHSPVPIAIQARRIATFRKEYEAHVAERAKEGIPPKPLDPAQTKRVCELLTEKTGADGTFGCSFGNGRIEIELMLSFLVVVIRCCVSLVVLIRCCVSFLVLVIIKRLVHHFGIVV